jgi:hypothetical protein
MQDYISRLPAPLPLYILLELSDLKALYAAILSSPHSYATFHLNAHQLFDTIARRSIAPDINTAIQVYIYLHDHLHDKAGQDPQQTLRERLQTALRDHTEYSSVESSAATIFHVLAQNVRLHDIGVSILKSKLEYLAALRPQKLADSEFRYRRETVMEQRPQGTALVLPAIIQKPSWPEENRMLWALWISNIARLASHRLPKCTYDTALVHITQILLGKIVSHFNWTESVMAEIMNCLLDGPSLKRKITVENNSHGLETLHPYEIPHPPYSTLSLISPNTIPSTPMYKRSPASKPTHKTITWEHFSTTILHDNPSAHYARAMTRAPDSPLQGADVCVSNRLGFDFWDRRRFCDDLHLRMPPRDHESYAGVAHLYASGGAGYISRSDMLFRLYSFYKEDKEREQNGWERGWSYR